MTNKFKRILVSEYIVESFVINALIGGIIVAAVAGMLGTFVIWKKISYFGDALSHSALLGVTIGFIFGINFYIAVVIFSIIFALIFSSNFTKYSGDTTLGILSYTSLSLAIITASYSKIKIDLISYLFGDVLAINIDDILMIVLVGCLILIWVYFNWSRLVMLSLSEELLKVEGSSPKRLNLMFSIVLALFIAISFKVVGILLITALLIIPAAAAMSISRSPLQMIILASIIGALSVIVGVFLAIYLNLPTGPSIIISSTLFFIPLNIYKMISRNC